MSRDTNERQLDRFVGVVYDELRRIAHNRLRRARRGYTLDTTGLVHEAYLRLRSQRKWAIEEDGTFLAAASLAMKQVIVRAAQTRGAKKRGGAELSRVSLGEAHATVELEVESILGVNRALDAVAARSPRLARVVECRFFAGFSEEETAKALGISLRTAQRDWKRARAWIELELSGSEPGHGS